MSGNQIQDLIIGIYLLFFVVVIIACWKAARDIENLPDAEE